MIARMTDVPLIRPASFHALIGGDLGITIPPGGAIDVPLLGPMAADVILSYQKSWLDRLAGIERFVVLEKVTVESSEVVGGELSYTLCGYGPMKERLRWRGWGILRAIKAWRCA
jgi:hypothetical protein